MHRKLKLTRTKRHRARVCQLLHTSCHLNTSTGGACSKIIVQTSDGTLSRIWLMLLLSPVLRLVMGFRAARTASVGRSNVTEVRKCGKDSQAKVFLE